MRRSPVGPLLALVVAVAILAGGCTSLQLPGLSAAASELPAATPGAGSAPKVGARAPDFSLKTPDGKLVTLSDFRGKPVFINFWATWCPPCRAEMPDIEAVYQEHRDHGLIVLGIDVQEDPVIVQRFLRERSFSWTFLVDESGEVGMLYRLTALPTSYFVDPEGVIRSIQTGATTKSGMERQLALILPKR
ncbi:MAG: redoxin domain-containing protein [Chloroflexi bacterium]|nr:redoxin domain-containing protein [Chloroflexota bacterium]